MMSLSSSLRSEASNWSYSKASVLEFFGDWRVQVSSDAYLSERERDLRLELIDRLCFQVDRKYTDENLRQFLQDATWDMALTDEMAQNKVWGGQAEFLRSLNASLKEVLEPSENILGFIRSYVEFTSLQRPRPLDEFVGSRSYTNGSEIEAAEDVSLEQAGKAAEALTSEPPKEPEYLKTPETHTETAPDQIPTLSLPQTEDERLIL